jgi:hypothetical protein
MATFTSEAVAQLMNDLARAFCTGLPGAMECWSTRSPLFQSILERPACPEVSGQSM